MPTRGCVADGTLNDGEFSAPMPWIGVYIAGASAACLVGMGADLVKGFRSSKFWFPCRYMSLNATTLTIIAVALKLSLDLNTPMPARPDQLAKLTSSALATTLISNSMPSLGSMSPDDLAANVVALAILVVTLLVNISIQLATGAVFVFRLEHAALMVLMLASLLLVGFTAVTVPGTKRFLEHKYAIKYDAALNEARPRCNLRHDMTKYWVMAHTCSPQFVVGRSVTCTASGALCLLSSAVLAQALFRSYLAPTSLRFCRGDSDYRWSTALVVATQGVAVAVGTVAPACRWLLAIRFRCPYRGNKHAWRSEFRVEKYWLRTLHHMKECPLTSPVFKMRSRRARRLAHDAKNRALDLCISAQIAIVFSSKLVRFVSIFSASRLLLLFDFCSRSSKTNTMIPEDEEDPRAELGRFVLHLEGEEALVDRMISRNCDATKHWFGLGTKAQPKDLINLLKDKSSPGFVGLAEFDSDRVACLDHEDPPNCWALPLVTLTSIAFTLPNIDRCAVKQLRCGVSQGLFYVKNMEKYLDTKADLSNLRKAAEVVWTEVDLYHKWLGFDLRATSLHQDTTPRQVLEQLSDIARTKFDEYKQLHMLGCVKEPPLKWHPKVLAANSMYRVTQSLLLRNLSPAQQLFEAITAVISDILCACMTNLHQVISVKCLSSPIEEREKSVRRAVFVLGQTEEILKILDRREIPDLDSKRMGCIDAWRLSIKSKSSCGSMASSETDDVYIAVD